MSVDGDIGSVGGGSLIAVEENSTMSEFAAQLRSAFISIATITPGIDGQRINFSGATVADFSNWYHEVSSLIKGLTEIS